MEEAQRASKPAQPVEQKKTTTYEYRSFQQLALSHFADWRAPAIWSQSGAQRQISHTGICVISTSWFKGLTVSAFKCCQKCEQAETTIKWMRKTAIPVILQMLKVIYNICRVEVFITKTILVLSTLVTTWKCRYLWPPIWNKKNKHLTKTFIKPRAKILKE